MPTKSSQLQIRVTPRQKAQLKRRAAAAGIDVSTLVLRTVLPPDADRFADLVRTLAGDSSERFVLAELNDLLTSTPAGLFGETVEQVDLTGLSAYRRNYVTAMVELAAHAKGATPPAWVRDIEPLDEPYFVGGLKSLRPHLLRNAPIAFKRRNIFVDASVGDRV